MTILNNNASLNFKNEYTAVKNNFETKRKIKNLDSKVYNFAKGYAIGVPAAMLAVNTGPLVALHEIVGHGLLGFDTVYTYDSGERPHFWVLGWDNLQDVIKAQSFKDFIGAFFNWITANNSPGVAGLAYPGQPHGFTPAGEAIGADGREAWISVAGSIPGLALDSLATVSGMFLRKRSPVLGNTLVTMGLLDNVTNASYPIDAALMNNAQLQAAARKGHDFANFALRMGHMLHLPPQMIAISTAAAWTSFVPLLALGTYLYTKSNATNAVPDLMAAQRWLSKASTDPTLQQELHWLTRSFANKGKYLQGKNEILQMQKYGFMFLEHVLANISPKSLEKMKLEILDSWSKHAKPDKLQTALTISAVCGNIFAVVTKSLQLLSQVVCPSLALLATILPYCSFLIIITAGLSAEYQTCKDYQCPDSVIPQSAKRLSAARLIINIACAILMVLSIAIPGLNGVFAVALLVGNVMNVILLFARSKIVERQFAKSHATSPETWEVMHALWLHHKNNPTEGKPSPILQRWAELAEPNHEPVFWKNAAAASARSASSNKIISCRI